MDYAQQMMPMGSAEPLALEQTMNMSPMDLFDSIFWGERFFPPSFLPSFKYLLPLDLTTPDAYPMNGLDQLGGFDYSNQLYPQF